MKLLSVLLVGLLVSLSYGDDIDVEDDGEEREVTQESNSTEMRGNVEYIDYEEMIEKIRGYEMIDGGEG
jgi:hypothetical protein